MLPAQIIYSLLCDLKTDVSELLYKSDFKMQENSKKTDLVFRAFTEVLMQSEDDLTFIFKMIEQDTDCKYAGQDERLIALMDYINITLAIYTPPMQNAAD